MTEVTLIGNHSQNVNDEWQTPEMYIHAARRVMGTIDVDPASNDVAQRSILANTYFTKENSALDKEWIGKVWLNPPYSRVIKAFVQKLVDQVRQGNVTEAIVLTNNGTDTSWFQMMGIYSSAICLPHGRIAFLRDGEPVDNNNKGQVFTYIGRHPERFCEVFGEFGQTYYRRNPRETNRYS